MKHDTHAHTHGPVTQANQYSDPHGPEWNISLADAEKFNARLIDPNNEDITGIQCAGIIARAWTGSVDKNPDHHPESEGERLTDRQSIVQSLGSNTPASLWGRYNPIGGTPSGLINIAQFKADYDGNELSAPAFFYKYFPTQDYNAFRSIVQDWKDRGDDDTGDNR